MLTVRRLIAAGGAVMLAAVFTCAYVLGEPARDDNKPKSAFLTDKDQDFTNDVSAPSRFADTPVLVYQPKDGDRLFALQVQPALSPAKARPRDLVILVDTTASQAGGHLVAGEKLLDALAAKLGDDDRVSLRTVNLKSHDLSHGFQPAHKLEAALAELKKELPMGAADIKSALDEALKSFDGGKDHQQAIVYIGDGMSIRNPVTPAELVSYGDRMVQNHIAFFPVPIGPRLDPSNLHGLASRTGGTTVRIGLKAEPTGVAQNLLDALSTPILYGASIEMPAEVSDHMPAKLPPLRGDAPTLLVGHMKPIQNLSYTLKGTVDGQEVTLKSVELKVPAPDADNFFLTGMVQQWQAAKDSPALIRADRALAFALEQTQMVVTDLLSQGRYALSENRYDIAAALFTQASDVDPTDTDARAMADLVAKLRDGKITRQQLQDALPKPKPKKDKKDVGQAEGEHGDVSLVLFEEQAGEKPAPPPVAPPVGGDDILQDAKRRAQIADQKASGLVDDVIRQSMRALNREPDAARDYLRRTLDAIRSDTTLSATTRERLSRRLEASLADAEIRGERIKQQQAERLAQQIRADATRQALTQTQELQNRVRERMRVFHNLMNQAREDEAYHLAQDIRQDLINQGAPVPQAVVSAYYIGQVAYNLREIRELRRVREERFLLTMLGVERSHIPFPDEPPIQFPPTPTWKALTDLRRGKYESSRLVGEVSKQSEQVSRQLNAPVEFRGFDDPDTKLGEALDYLQRAYGIPFDVNQQAFKDEMIDDVLTKPLGKEIPKMKNVSLSTVLRKVLERIPANSGTTWVIRNGVVEITTGRYAAFEKAIVAYPIADLAIPITNTQQQASVLQPGQLFGLQGFNGLAGIGGIAGLAGIGGVAGLAGVGGLAGLGGIGGLAGVGGIGGLAGVGGIGGLNGNLAGIGGINGQIGGIGGLQGGIAGVPGIGGFQGLQGQGGGGANLGLGAIGGTQAPLLVRMITQIVGEPDDWAPIDPLQQIGIPNKPGGEPDDIDKKPFKNQLAFYPPALALVVKGSSRIQTRPTPPILKNIGEGGLNQGALDKHNPNVKVAGAGDDRPGKKKPPLADADPKTFWQEQLAKENTEPGVILACVDFLGTMGRWDHASELLKANIRQGIVVRPWVYEALAMTLRESNASAEEIERAETSAADLEPLDAHGFLRAAKAMHDLRNPRAALAFCRQAALLEPSVAGPYRDALGYAAAAKDNDGMEWAASQLLSHDWPSDNAVLHQEAENRVKDLVSALAGSEKSEAAEKMLARLQEARRRDLEITLSWENGDAPADLDMVIEEPTGSSCTWRAPQTVGGGIRLGGGVGDRKVVYVAAQGFEGTYRVRVERIFGHPLGDKAQLRVVRHKGTPEEREEIISVPVPRGTPDPKKDAVSLRLDGGRRTNVADVPPPATTQRLNTARKSGGSTNDAIGQLQRLADPTEVGFGGSGFGIDGPGGKLDGNSPEPGMRDELTYQTRVAPFATNSTNATVQAVVSADRRYVRLSVAPTFNVVTGTKLQGVQIRNPIIPGFPVP